MTPGPHDYPQGEVIPGTVYLVLRRIGAGGMGTVYDVEDTTIGKRYVLKALHPQLGDREDLAQRLRVEARTLARLRHPNIIEVITFGITGDDRRLPFYVMERLEGQSLRVILEKKKKLVVPHALHIAIDLLDALTHAHDQSVIHRDVKPDNLFMHNTPANITVTKLLDFGIVSLLGKGPRETAGRFIGTLRYAAPEQLRGGDPSPQMDIYCAALVLYEMIAGEGPFDSMGGSQQIAEGHLHHNPPPLSKFEPVPRELDALMATALAKLPDSRPRGADTFALNLRNLKHALFPQDEPNSTANRATALVGSHPAQAAPFVDVRRSASIGAYVVSPARAPAAPAPPEPPEPLPRTTMRGMVQPTMGMGPAPAPAHPGLHEDLPITAQMPELVDRQAPTHSYVAPRISPGLADTEGMALAPGQGGTLRVHPLPMVDDVVPMRWPPDRPPVSSEEAHVRTLPLAQPRTSRPALVMALSAALGLAAVAAVVVVFRHAGPPHPVAAAPTEAVVAASGAPPDPKAVLAIPAPTLAPPALAELVPASTTAAMAATSSDAPSASAQPARPAARPRASSAKPASPPLLSDRPGPGF
jgi:serine/threonine protein kinase